MNEECQRCLLKEYVCTQISTPNIFEVAPIVLKGFLGIGIPTNPRWVFHALNLSVLVPFRAILCGCRALWADGFRSAQHEG